MAPGKYVVVPSTYNPGEEADFLVRLYSEKQNQAEYAFDHKYGNWVAKRLGVLVSDGILVLYCTRIVSIV